MLAGAILCAAVLLLLGVGLRAVLPPLRAALIPASVVGGLIGLLVVQGSGRWLEAELAEPVVAMATTFRSWPAMLIAVVFAGLLLERPQRSWINSVRGAALQGIMVWIIVLGQVAIGLAATALFILPRYDVPIAFGQLLEAGFAGGHGTAAAMGAIYGEVLSFPEGLDLGLFMATVGLVYSLVSGIVLVNIAVRRGWVRRGEASWAESGSVRVPGPAPAAALIKIRPEIIDPLAFQVALVAVAMLLGIGLRWCFLEVLGVMDLGNAMQYIDRIPLFLFTLLGGWFLRLGMTLLRIDDLIDDHSVKRIVALAMEFLIVAALASLRIEVVASYGWPLLLLCGLGFAWTAFCLLVLARRILPPGYWFELGIINYGMSTGTTAQGVLLLRMIDPDLSSPAAADYALAAPLSAPFIGGGVITMSLPLILSQVGMPITIGALTVATVVLIFVGQWMQRR